jgi:biotin carboxylase
MNSTGGKLGEIQEIAESIGYPVIVKPSGGGGGIGMIPAKNRRELVKAVQFAEERGRKIFGVSSFYIEKLFSGMTALICSLSASQISAISASGIKEE